MVGLIKKLNGQWLRRDFRGREKAGKKGGMVSQMKSEQDGLCGEAGIKPRGRRGTKRFRLSYKI